jgi:hypothetical protein
LQKFFVKMLSWWKICFFATIFAEEILLDGSFEERQWEISPSWALCNAHSCTLPPELSPGAHSGTHFILAYPDRKVVIAQRFNDSSYAECRLEFYARTTNRLNSFITIFWNTNIVELTSYSKQSVIGDWDFYSISLSGGPDNQHVDINSAGNINTTVDDFSLNCASSHWTWTWSIEFITFIIIAGIAVFAGIRFLQKHHFVSVALDRMGIQLPECPHWFKPKKPAVEEYVLSAFQEDSDEALK